MDYVEDDYDADDNNVNEFVGTMLLKKNMITSYNSLTSIIAIIIQLSCDYHCEKVSYNNQHDGQR